MNVSKKELLELLHAGVVTVSFVKLNGEVRVMPCTLKEELIPGVKPIKEAVESATTATNPILKPTISVWCTDVGAWRSFRFDSVTKVELMTKTWTAVLEEDAETGNLLLPLPPDLLEQLEWKEGDDLEWGINEETQEIRLTKIG